VFESLKGKELGDSEGILSKCYIFLISATMIEPFL
jgi:hypothetical protein